MAHVDQKQQAQQLLELLDAGQLAAVVHLLELMTDPVTRAITQAPTDEESLSSEDINALDAARQWSERNDPIPHSQVLADFGFTQEEIERHKTK